MEGNCGGHNDSLDILQISLLLQDSLSPLAVLPISILLPNANRGLTGQ